jgi:hypothetical protein
VIDFDALDAIMEAFATEAQLGEAARIAASASASFETHVQIARSIGGAGEAQRVQLQVLANTDAIAKVMAPSVRRMLPAAARRLAPAARDVTNIRLSVVALKPGSTMRLDLASEPVHASDLMLTALFSTTGRATATLAMLRGPLRLAGVDPRRGQVSLPLFERRGVVIPALRPAALTVGPGADRTFVMTALCTLKK